MKSQVPTNVRKLELWRRLRGPCGLRFCLSCGKIRTLTAKLAKKHRKERKDYYQDVRNALLLDRFQYKYPGTPISTIAVPQKASVGRVIIVFSVQAAPIST